MIIQRVDTPELAMVLMDMRNAVRSFMTGSQEMISEEQQKQWFSNLDHDLIKIWIYAEEGHFWHGYGQLRIEPGTPRFGVSTHAVLENVRGRGFGEFILRHIIDMARENGCDAMRAEILKSNAPSLGQVHKLGYIDTKDMGDVVEVQLSL